MEGGEEAVLPCQAQGDGGDGDGSVGDDGGGDDDDDCDETC